MNSCCTRSVETIASVKHRDNEECCLVTEKTDAPPTAACPVSGTSSRKVQRRTLKHLLKPERVGAMAIVQYYYCAEVNCNVVYFSSEAVPYFTIDDVRVKVFAKDKGEDVNVCYCFDWTRARIKKELVTTGTSTASLQIARGVRSGNCTCDVKNPKGECCLGNLNTFVKTIAAAIAPI
jgi:hypothetical protein